MITKMNIQWSTSTLARQIDANKVNFELAVQRGNVWNNQRDSLLIHSMMAGYPIPAFYFSRNEDKVYEALDGKQRSHAIYEYYKGNYKLHATTPSVKMEDGSEIEVAGLTFDELPDELQSIVKDYSLTIYYFDGITQDDIDEIFYRINNGKPLTAIELTRVKAQSLDKFQRIAKHPAILSATTESGRLKYADEQIVMQIWVMLYSGNPSFMTKTFRPEIENADVTDEQEIEITNALDYLSNLYENVEESGNKKLLRKIKTKTHLVSLAYMAYLAQSKDIDVDQYIEKAIEFFTTEDGETSTSDAYNSSIGAGSAKPEMVRIRMDEIKEMLFDGDVETTDSEESE